MNRALPSLLERMGTHAMRDIARRWCREHVDEALKLPCWSCDVVRDVWGEATASEWESSRSTRPVPRSTHVGRGAMDD